MRLASLAIASLLLTSTPVLAQSAAAVRSAEPACVARLVKTSGAAEYKVIRQCAKATKVPASVRVAQQPVTDGSNQSGGIGFFEFFYGVVGFTTAFFVAELTGVTNVLNLDGDDVAAPTSP